MSRNPEAAPATFYEEDDVQYINGLPFPEYLSSQIESLPTGTPTADATLAYVHPAQSRKVRGFVAGDLANGTVITIGGLSGTIGNEISREPGDVPAQSFDIAGYFGSNLASIPALSVTDNGDGTFDVVCEPGVNSLEFSSTDPNLVFVDWVKVEGAGTDNENAVWRPTVVSEVGGVTRAQYIRGDDTYIQFDDYGDGFEWVLSDANIDSFLYRVSSSASTPIGLAFETFNGTAPAPTVSTLGADAEMRQAELADFPVTKIVTATVQTNVGTKQALLPAVPVGKTRIIVNAVIRNASADLSGMAGALKLGFNGAADDYVLQVIVALASSAYAIAMPAGYPAGIDSGAGGSATLGAKTGTPGAIFGCVFADASITGTADIDVHYYDVDA